MSWGGWRGVEVKVQPMTLKKATKPFEKKKLYGMGGGDRSKGWVMKQPIKQKKTTKILKKKKSFALGEGVIMQHATNETKGTTEI